MSGVPDVDNPSGRLRPDDVVEFRIAQLILLLAESRTRPEALDLYRLSVLDFLAANPFLVVGDSDQAYKALRMAGFGAHSLSYAAPGQRYATRRERLINDLTLLVSYGLVTVAASAGHRIFEITAIGIELADQLPSNYADAYRASAHEMLPRIARLTDTALQRQLGGWLRADPVLFDLLDLDIGELRSSEADRV
jgi:hypothetical protein